jgi:hypothetical protein
MGKAMTFRTTPNCIELRQKLKFALEEEEGRKRNKKVIVI